MESIHELLANDLVNASVPICWETHITAFNSAGEQISPGAWLGICVRGNTYLRYTTSAVFNLQLISARFEFA